MGLTAWAEEQQAKHEAWREINELKRQNAALLAERDALAALLEKMKFITPEMLRAAQVRSELGAYACSELSGAYSLISEIYTVMVGEFMKQTTPQQCLREIRAESWKDGYLSGWKARSAVIRQVQTTQELLNLGRQYAERVKAGRE